MFNGTVYKAYEAKTVSNGERIMLNNINPKCFSFTISTAFFISVFLLINIHRTHELTRLTIYTSFINLRYMYRTP